MDRIGNGKGEQLQIGNSSGGNSRLMMSVKKKIEKKEILGRNRRVESGVGCLPIAAIA